MTTVIVNVGLLIANLVVFGLTLKLYTEYFKDRSHGSRSAPTRQEQWP